MPPFKMRYMLGFSSPPLILGLPSDCRSIAIRSSLLVSSNGMPLAALLFNAIQDDFSEVGVIAESEVGGTLDCDHLYAYVPQRLRMENQSW